MTRDDILNTLGVESEENYIDTKAKFLVDDIMQLLATQKKEWEKPFYDAFHDKGINPRYHDSQVERLKSEWPILYELLAHLSSKDQGGGL